MSLRARARRARDYAVEIAATASAYPSLVVDDAAYLARARFAIEEPERLAEECGVRARRWCDEGESAWTLAREAGLAAARAANAPIDLVLVASGTTMPVLHPADAALPGVGDLAPRLARELGLDDALGIDLKACYCTGFVRGLEVADAMLGDRGYRAALVVAAEQGSRLATAASNRSAFCFLMADAAGAAVLVRREGPPEGPAARGLVDLVNATDADKLDWIAVGDDGLSMRVRGARAGEATIDLLVRAGRLLLERNGLEPSDVDWLLPVQTHRRVVEAARAALGFPASKLLWNAAELGFSGSASVPAALADARASGRVRDGDRVLVVAVGAGMSWGGALLRA